MSTHNSFLTNIRKMIANFKSETLMKLNVELAKLLVCQLTECNWANDNRINP